MNEVQSYEHNDSSKIFGDVQNSGAQRYAGKYMYLIISKIYLIFDPSLGTP